MALLSEDPPPRGIAQTILPGIRRIVARNPGAMSYHGTNTWLVDDGADGVLVVDPGPADHTHLQDILHHSEAPIRAILITHYHADHSGNAGALRHATGAPIVAFDRFALPQLAIDIAMAHGDRFAGIRALHTPGHASDHLCFQREDGTLFSGDVVMGWASTVVSPPDGSMTAYLASLEMLLVIGGGVYLPGHGPAILNPEAHVLELLNRRRQREDEILALLGAAPATPEDIRLQLYHKVEPRLVRAASRNVMAHLEKLAMEGRAVCIDGAVWCSTSAAPSAGPRRGE